MDLARTLLRRGLTTPDAEAIVAGGRRWSYGAWSARIERLAGNLHAVGIAPEMRVALVFFTGEEFVTSFMACQRLGAVPVPVNYRLTAAEMAFILADSGASAVIYATALRERILPALALSGGVDIAVCAAGQPSDSPPGHHAFEELAERTAGPVPVRADSPPDALCSLIYTSGTTGRPKGVMHTHANDLVIALNCVLSYGLQARDRALHIKPLFHVGGLNAFFLPHVLVGAANVIVERYTPKAALEAMERERITTLSAVTTQIQDMLDAPGFATRDLASLRMITTGGSAMSAKTMRRTLRDFCPQLYNGYGLTEASLSLLLPPDEARSHPGATGRPTFITKARLVRRAGDRPSSVEDTVAEGEVGELIVAGPQVSPGYWRNPSETQRRFRDGWLFTGDLMRRDQDGLYQYLGRADDMIVSGAENIYPAEVEQALRNCPGVREVAVVGLPDPRWGHAVAAFIVPSDPSLSAEAVESYLLAQGELAPYKRPRRIRFVETLPRNDLGKLLRHKLLEVASGTP